MLSRRPIVCALALAAALCSVTPAIAQEWPQRTVKLVVGYGAGGGTDLVARIVAQAVQE